MGIRVKIYLVCGMESVFLFMVSAGQGSVYVVSRDVNMV